MNTIDGFLLKALFLTIILTIPSFAQRSFDRQRVIYNQIAPLIHGRYGQDYRFNYTMMDSVVRYSDDDNIQDPYGTLKGCILFSAYRSNSKDYTFPDTFVVGMVKNGQIIWDNFPGSEINLSDDDYYGDLLFSQDINNDGDVDLVFGDYKWFSPGQPSLTWIRILSWNGTQGRIISGDMIGSGGIDLLDVDGSGVKCIRAELLTGDEVSWSKFKTTTFPYVTYGWNGTQYGLWPNVMQVPEDQPLPANRFEAIVSCSVAKSDSLFNYSYAVSNNQSSEQRIDWILIGGIEDTSVCCAPLPWTAGTSVAGGRRFGVRFDKLRYAMKPGQTMAGFMTQSVGLPMIVNYYLQGSTGTVCCSTPEASRQNVLTNSVTGRTLGTRVARIPASALLWLDTLSSYTTQSLSLGWIKGQATANKYLNYFDTAKTQLQSGDSIGARETLRTVAANTISDTTMNLTSEAYALLKYNAEYLMGRLPEGRPGR